MSTESILGKNPGYLVETKTGKQGKIYHREGLVNKKTVVHIKEMKLPMLCDPKSLKIIGYFD
jgi:hypothetical protein